MEPAVETRAAAAVREVLAEATGILEPVGPREEAELPAQVLAEFVADSRKKDKLLCSQLQVADLLQNFLAQQTSQGLDPLASEDISRQKAVAAKEQWKELKAAYQEHVEDITRMLTHFTPKVDEVQKKRAQLQDALEQLQAKKQLAAEKLRTAQKQWQLQQEKQVQFLAEVSAEVRNAKTGIQQELEQLSRELEALKQQSLQEQDKLRRHQIFLQLLYTLQGQVQAEEPEPQTNNLPEEKPQ
ncbi:ZW10 interactor [Erinaceus europaeus]|uniref:ZW10 interactor n=1 Tax=Erinaceus europaeus TaxID=9365 RepID=A0A1S3WBZ6_ERIEU|nr:ZW10 interactor [Erinaceus europaeus]XP_060045339.1 ZW10 interactor [Erinaceus europaeus]XP_060045394.1 ZW10 interactor [Erinaceus europaeus]